MIHTTATFYKQTKNLIKIVKKCKNRMLSTRSPPEKKQNSLFDFDFRMFTFTKVVGGFGLGLGGTCFLFTFWKMKFQVLEKANDLWKLTEEISRN